jgi:hypothetical protein
MEDTSKETADKREDAWWVKLDDKEGESHLDSSSELPEGVIVIHA